MKVLAIATANLLRFVRDRSNAFFVFILPLGIVLLIGAQFGGGFAPHLGVYAATPEDPITVDIVEDLEDGDELEVDHYETEEDVVLAVERGAVSAAVSIPGDLESVLAAGGTAEVGFVSRPDGLGPQLQAVVAEAVSRAVEPVAAASFAVSRGADDAAAAAAAEQVVEEVPDIVVTVATTGESLFPATLGQYDIGASSQLVLFMFLTGLTGSVALIQTRQLGVSTRMVGTPTSVGTIITGEALGRFVIVLVQGLYIMFATVLLFRVEWGDPLGAAAILVAFAAVAAGAAMLFGALFRTDQQAGGVSVVVGIGMAALGGSMLPLELFSDTMLVVARFTPHAWALDAFAELVREDGTIGTILPQLGVLVGMAVVVLALATWRMRVVITRH